VTDRPSRVRRLRGRDEASRWVAWGATPDERLRPAVLRYVGYAAHSAHPAPRREPPGTVIPMVITFDAPYRIRSSSEADDRVYDAFLGGLTNEATFVEGAPRERCIQVDFTPPGARRLLGLPMELVAHQTVELSDLLGPLVDLLRERLREAADWDARFDLLDEVLLARMASTAAVSAEVSWAWSELERTHGGIRVGALTSELGWSRRRLGAAFREEIGLTPKPVARLLRFEEARRRLAAGDPAVVAADAAGFADQAHMVREFQALAGVPPSRAPTELSPEEQIFKPDGT
jgi:AraC-like DNA-binding protein